MERQLFLSLYRFVMSLPRPRRFRVQFSDHVIVLVLLWGMIHDRPMCWACDERNWPRDVLERMGQLPSVSTLSRRAGRQSVRALLELARQVLRDRFPRGELKIIDSRPLVVSGITQDRDAQRRGRVPGGGKACGYRLHAVVDEKTMVVEHWTLLPINRNDKIGALLLLEHAGEGETWVGDNQQGLGDNQHDSNRLYPRAAARRARLLAPPRKLRMPRDGGRRSTPERRESLAVMTSAEGRRLLKRRKRVESVLARLANTPGLLGPLPNWVRKPRRVALWIGGKLLIDTLRHCQKHGLTR